jgi:hypothetical protein
MPENSTLHSLFNEYDLRTRASLQWLKTSIDVFGGKGSSAYYSRVKLPFKGWQLPYPETTGYIIETLFQYADEREEEWLNRYAFGCADWLTALQLDSGAFPGGYRDLMQPSVFNTGQIIFGLLAAYEKSNDPVYFGAVKKATEWLVKTIEPDGSWRKAGYVPGYVPSYNTRVIWPVLRANTLLQSEETASKMRLALDYYGKKLTPDNSVKDWAAFPGKKAVTHFIAYTIRGFLESGLLLKEERWITAARNILDQIVMLYNKNGRLAGSYDEQWNGDFRFTCVTGNCQMALNLCRMYAVTGEQVYYDTAVAIFSDILPAQRLSSHPAGHGAIPGSVPLWGQYLPFRYPNHAVKFFLDAYYQLKNVVNT